MIQLQNGITPDARSPTKLERNGRKTVDHRIIRDEMMRQFRFIYGVSVNFQLTTTPDGMDGVMWANLSDHGSEFATSGLRPSRYLSALGYRLCIAMVHSNSRRQKTAFYGGITCREGILVFDKIPMKIREHDLEVNTEKTLSRWGLFIDRYWDRYRELRDFTLSRSEYQSLVVQCGEDDILSWSRIGRFHGERHDSETALSFLLRLSRHIGRQPPISHEPARSQPWSMYAGYQRIWELRT